MIRAQGGTTLAAGYAGAFALAVLDRLLKALIEQPHFDTARIGWRYFAFEQFHNPGVAFGIPLPLGLVLPATILFLVGIWWFAVRTQIHSMRVATALISAGALSNAFDRIMYGYTIDYLRIAHGIINIADLLVVAGVLVLILKQPAPKSA